MSVPPILRVLEKIESTCFIVNPFSGLSLCAKMASASIATFSRDGTSEWHYDLKISSGKVLKIGGNQVVASRQAAVADPTGGAVVDTECRAALVELLARLRPTAGHGLIGA